MSAQHPVEADLVATIETWIRRAPRTLQKRIGPSEVGIPCDRRVGLILAGAEHVNDRGIPWKPFVGTALHSEVGMIFEVDAYDGKPNAARWAVEAKVAVGAINGVDIDGTTDLFDRQTGTAVDWKFTTRNKLREYRRNGPGDQYRIQAHTYGRGWAEQGHDVAEVAIFFWTRDGEFHDRYFWSEPYDEQVALDALARATDIAQTVDALGLEVALPLLPTADAYCLYCPWYDPAAPTDSGASCAGHPDRVERPDSVLSLIATTD